MYFIVEIDKISPCHAKLIFQMELADYKLDRTDPILPQFEGALHGLNTLSLPAELKGLRALEPESFLAKMKVLLREVPATTLLEAIRQRGQMEVFADALMPAFHDALAAYASSLPNVDGDGTSSAPSNVEIFEQLPYQDRFLLSLLMLKHPDSALHSLDAMVVANWLTQKWEPCASVLSDRQKGLLIRAAAGHDVGKGNIEASVIDSSLNGYAMPAAYWTYLADPQRTQSIAAPFEMSAEQERQFAPLLTAQDFDPSRIRDFLQLCKERGGGDYRHIPMWLFADVSRQIAETGDYPNFVREHFEEELVIDPKIPVTLQGHLDELQRMDEILPRYGLTPDTTFKQAIDLHEAVSAYMFAQNFFGLERFELPNPQLAHLIGGHHGNNGCLATAVGSNLLHTNPKTEETAEVGGFLGIVDLATALARTRSYRRSDEPDKPVRKIRKIIQAMARKGKLPGHLARNFNEQLLATADPDRTDAFAVMAGNLGLV